MTEFAKVQPDYSTTVTSLGRLIARLALDEKLYTDYLNNPEKVIKDAGLSEEEAAALRSEDWKRIKASLGPGPKPLTEKETG